MGFEKDYEQWKSLNYVASLGFNADVPLCVSKFAKYHPKSSQVVR